MIWKDIKAKTIEGLINVLNKELRHFTKNLDENNSSFKYIHIKTIASADVPTPSNGGHLFIDSADDTLKIKHSNGSITTV